MLPTSLYILTAVSAAVSILLHVIGQRIFCPASLILQTNNRHSLPLEDHQKPTFEYSMGEFYFFLQYKVHIMFYISISKESATSLVCLSYFNRRIVLL